MSRELLDSGAAHSDDQVNQDDAGIVPPGNQSRDIRDSRNDDPSNEGTDRQE